MWQSGQNFAHAIEDQKVFIYLRKLKGILPLDESSDRIDRNPVSFGDLRGWISALREAKELAEFDQEVDWDTELGTIVRMAQGTGAGPAFLFKNIKDYNTPESVCREVFTNGQGSYSRLAMMFGLKPDTPIRDMVKMCRYIFKERIPPRTVRTGPVKDNIITGRDIDLFKFPIPKWNREMAVDT